MINEDALKSLERLHQLKNDGVITEEDFERAKGKLLGATSTSAKHAEAPIPAAANFSRDKVLAPFDGTLPHESDTFGWMLLPLRRYVMAGGTFLGVAHTNKNKSATGKLVHAGTSDLRDDFDAAYMLEPRKKPSGKEALVIFEAIKRRGGGVEKVTYAYGCEDEMSYLEQLVSVREAHDGEEEEFVSPINEAFDANVIEVIKSLIVEGVVKKMELAMKAAGQAHVSQRQAMKVLEAYTGDEPGKHHWTFKVGAKGAKMYSILDQPIVVEHRDAA